MSTTVVALLFGGQSSEHEISIISAKAIAANIDRKKYTVFPLYISRQGKWFKGKTASLLLDLDIAGLLKTRGVEGTGKELLAMTGNQEQDLFDFDFQKKGLDVVFPILHGTYGEDGKVQGLLEMFGIPYTGCDVPSSAITIDKDITKICASRAGMNVAKHITVTRHDYLENPARVIDSIMQQFSLPLFIKPAHLGSSIGISKVHAFENLGEALGEAFRFDTKVLAEEAIEGREIEVAVLGNQQPFASVPGEIEAGSDFYDYTDKYIASKAHLYIPARVDREIQDALKKEAVKAYKALGCSGMSRIDFFLEQRSGNIILNEINTIPGFTGISMYPMLMEKSGISFPALIDKIIQFALEKYRGHPKL